MKKINLRYALRHACRALQRKWQAVGVALMLSCPAWADDTPDNPIPVSNEDVPTQGGSDLLMTFLHIIKEFGELVAVGGAIFLLWKGLSGIWTGYTEFRKTSDFTPLKESVFGAALMVVAGAVLLALLAALLTKT